MEEHATSVDPYQQNCSLSKYQATLISHLLSFSPSLKLHVERYREETWCIYIISLFFGLEMTL